MLATRRAKIAATIAVTLGATGWILWQQYAIHLPGMLDRWRKPIGPYQQVVWQPGPEIADTLPSERPPNIVLIVADDLGWNDITFYGGGVADGTVPTRHIDSIARDGMHFPSAYAANGTCAPSRAAIMSGRYPTRFGFEFTPMPGGMARIATRLARQDPDALHPPVSHFRGWSDGSLPYDQMGMPQSEITIADLLHAKGYRTLHIGKWHLGHANGSAPIDQGFDESVNMSGGLYLPENHPQVVNSKQDFDPIDRFLWANLSFSTQYNEGPRFAPDRYLTDYFTEQAVRAIEANRHRPFFLYLAHWAPHTPLQALRADYDALDHIEDHTLRVYAAMIRALDRGVGRVLGALRDHGLEENTLVLFTSDNGGANYLGLPDINQPYRGWKITFFEGGIRVPYFLKWPAAIPPGGVFEHPVQHFDIYATAAAAARAELPDDRVIDGKNLLAVGADPTAAAPHDALFWRSGHYQVVVADGWKLQVAERPPQTWLFHLAEDPTEQHNLAPSHPGRVAELRASLAAHNAQQVAPLWPSQVELAVSIDKTLKDKPQADDEYVYWPN